MPLQKDKGGEGKGTKAECARRTGKSRSWGQQGRQARGSRVECVRNKEEGTKEESTRPEDDEESKRARRAKSREE